MLSHEFSLALKLINFTGEQIEHRTRTEMEPRNRVSTARDTPQCLYKHIKIGTSNIWTMINISMCLRSAWLYISLVDDAFDWEAEEVFNYMYIAYHQ